MRSSRDDAGRSAPRVTRHAAAALSRKKQIGSLIRGARADLVVLEAKSYLDLAYHYGVNLARAVLTGAGTRVADPMS